MAQCERPAVRTALVYILKGDLTREDVETLKRHVINPVERREASLEKPETLRTDYALPETVATMTGFVRFDEEELALSLIHIFLHRLLRRAIPRRPAGGLPQEQVRAQDFGGGSMKSASESYKQAGVDSTAGYRAVELMKQHVAVSYTHLDVYKRQH